MEPMDLVEALRALGFPDPSSPEETARHQAAMATLYEALIKLAQRVIQQLPPGHVDDLEGFRRGLCSEVLIKQAETVGRWTAMGEADRLPSTEAKVRGWLRTSLQRASPKFDGAHRRPLALDSLDDAGPALAEERPPSSDRLHLAMWERMLESQGVVDAVTGQPLGPEATDRLRAQLIERFRCVGHTMAVLQGRADNRASTLFCVDALVRLLRDETTPDEIYAQSGKQENAVQKMMGRFRDRFLVFLEDHEAMAAVDVAAIPEDAVEEALAPETRRRIRGAREVLLERVDRVSAPEDVHHVLEDIVYPRALCGEERERLRALIVWLREGALMARPAAVDVARLERAVDEARERLARRRAAAAARAPQQGQAAGGAGEALRQASRAVALALGALGERLAEGGAHEDAAARHAEAIAALRGLVEPAQGDGARRGAPIRDLGRALMGQGAAREAARQPDAASAAYQEALALWCEAARLAPGDLSEEALRRAVARRPAYAREVARCLMGLDRVGRASGATADEGSRWTTALARARRALQRAGYGV